MCSQFDGVLDNVSQEAVYEACAREAVGQSLCGYNSTIFAYGQVHHTHMCGGII
jgi:hypothetical protein